MTEPANPVQVETAIRTLANRISAGVLECDKSYRAWLAAERDYDRAFARAYLRHDGPAHEKKYAAELATEAERDARDVADAVHRLNDRQSKALQDELRAWQSIGASVRGQYAVAGRGE